LLLFRGLRSNTGNYRMRFDASHRTAAAPRTEENTENLPLSGASVILLIIKVLIAKTSSRRQAIKKLDNDALKLYYVPRSLVR
jgi:hypothetical protein